MSKGERQTAHMTLRSLMFTTGCEFLPYVSCVKGEKFIAVLKTTDNMDPRAISGFKNVVTWTIFCLEFAASALLSLSVVTEIP